MTETIWKLTAPSTSFLGGGVELEKRLGRQIALRYELEGAGGEPMVEAIVFDGVESFKCTYAQACGEWALAAYDRLVEVADSSWRNEVAEQLRKSGAIEPALRHLMIYFDDGPCYEVICRGFRIEG